MKVVSVNFITSAVLPEHYPDERLPEVAFIGRSNAGKSSLINSLVNRKKLVKVSSTPGKTRLINFFRINEKVIFVDLPGYGYAKVSKKIHAGWKDMIESYLKNREQLKGVVHIIDSRHNPTRDDLLMHEWLKYYNINTIVIGTKVDKIAKTKRIIQEREIKRALCLDDSAPFIFFSSKNGEGKKGIWKLITLLI